MKHYKSVLTGLFPFPHSEIVDHPEITAIEEEAARTTGIRHAIFTHQAVPAGLARIIVPGLALIAEVPGIGIPFHAAALRRIGPMLLQELIKATPLVHEDKLTALGSK